MNFETSERWSSIACVATIEKPTLRTSTHRKWGTKQRAQCLQFHKNSNLDHTLLHVIIMLSKRGLFFASNSPFGSQKFQNWGRIGQNVLQDVLQIRSQAIKWAIARPKISQVAWYMINFRCPNKEYCKYMEHTVNLILQRKTKKIKLVGFFL